MLSLGIICLWILVAVGFSLGVGCFVAVVNMMMVMASLFDRK